MSPKFCSLCQSGLFSKVFFPNLQVEDEVIERKQFLEEMSKVGLSARMKQEIEGEIAGKLREMKLLRAEREKQIESLERLKSKCP